MTTARQSIIREAIQSGWNRVAEIEEALSETRIYVRFSNAVNAAVVGQSNNDASKLAEERSMILKHIGAMAL